MRIYACTEHSRELLGLSIDVTLARPADRIGNILLIELLMCRGRDTGWWLRAEYWYWPLRCYYAMGGILDEATLGRCWVGDAVVRVNE